MHDTGASWDTCRLSFHEYYEAADGEPLPLDLGQTSLWLTDEDKVLLAELAQAQRDALNADILICTQTSLFPLLWRLRYFDLKDVQNGGTQQYQLDYGGYEVLIGWASKAC